MSPNAYEKVGLVVGIPTADLEGRDKEGNVYRRNIVPFEWAIGLLTQSYPLSMSAQFICIRGQHVETAREMIVAEAKKSKAKYLWFLDNDVQVPQNTARELIYQLEQDEQAMVAGGIYFSKRDPTEPLIFKDFNSGPYWQWKVGEVFEVEAMGTGCMMIKMEVFEKLEAPYFKLIDEDAKGKVFRHVVGEDMYFCEQVRKAGYKILADGKVLCAHWDTEKGIPWMIPNNSFPMRNTESKVVPDYVPTNGELT